MNLIRYNVMISLYKVTDKNNHKKNHFLNILTCSLIYTRIYII